MKKYLIGLDNGGSMIKCAVFDLAGGELAVASRRLPLQTPAPGVTERDAADVWRANAEAVSEAIAKSGADPSQIAAVGLTGYGNGVCLVDGAGEPVYNCIVSTDSRASGYLAAWEKDGTAEKVYDRTYQCLWAAQPAALLPWFRDHRPDILRRAGYSIGIKDFVRFKLTGRICAEITEASSGCLMNIKTLEFDPEIFSLLGIGGLTRLMPPVIRSTDVAGFVTEEAARATGIPCGTPVVGGYFDIDAGALASGVLNDDHLCCIAGTWSINEYITPDLESGYGKFSNTVSYLPGYYTVEDSSPTSASNFDWFVEKLIEADFPGTPKKELYRRCDRLLEKMPPEENDVVFIPYLYASATNPRSRGAFFNLTGYHTRDHMMQAVYEGVVFSTKFHLARLTRGRGPCRAVRLTGGIVNSPVWTQMMADALQMPVQVVRGSELSSRGAAMCAAIGCGLYRGFDEAVEKMVHIDRTYTPNPAMGPVYERKFRNYMRALDALDQFHS